MVQVLMLGKSKAEAMKKVFGEEGPDLPLLPEKLEDFLQAS